MKVKEKEEIETPAKFEEKRETPSISPNPEKQ
jgi:hypothetical protein